MSEPYEFNIISKTYGSHIVITDIEDKILIDSHKWRINKPSGSDRLLYVTTYIGPRKGVIPPKHFLLHRMILNPPEDMCIDHINGNGLDNRRSNLKICTHAENMLNRHMNKNNSSGYRGVYWSPRHRQFIAELRRQNKLIRFGLFRTAEEANKVIQDFLNKEKSHF